jgi:carbon storage regulator
MLVLSRKIGEQIVIGEDIRLTVVAIHGNYVRLAIKAPAGIAIHRLEVGGLCGQSSGPDARSAGLPER